MINRCIGCYKALAISYKLCEECLLELEPSDIWHEQVVAIYQYQGLIRDLILRVKLEEDMMAFASLLKMFNSSKRIKHFFKADAVVSVPPSAISRLKGKVDIAWHLAREFEKLLRVRRVKPPYSLCWNFRKRSKLTNRVFQTSYFDLHYVESRKNLVIIDDVVTSGYSLYRIAEAFPGYNLHYLSLASAIDQESITDE